MQLNYKTDYFKYKKYFLRINELYNQPIAKASLAAILSLFTFSFIILVAIKPAIITIINLQRSLKENQEINNILKKKVKDLTQAQSNYIALQQDLYYLDRSLPLKADFNRLAGEINFLAYSNNLTLSSGSFGEFDLLTPTSKGIAPFKFQLALAGSYPDTKNFISDLNILDRIIKINSVNLSIKNEADKSGLQANISGEAYWFPMPVKSP